MASQKQPIPRIAFGVHGAAVAVDRSDSFIQKAIAAGDLPSHKVRGARVILASDLEAFIGADKQQRAARP
jgi:hypothetical protein